MSAVSSSRIGNGYPRSLLIGVTFAVAWSPCIGPILGAVLTLAAASGTAGQGALLLACYSLGLGVWFLAFGLSFGWIAPRLRRVQRYMPAIMAVAGGLLIIAGALMLLGEFARLNRYFQDFGFFFDQTADAEADLATQADGLWGPVIAFLGGTLSFLSPCILPLVPAYLGNLAGEAVLASDRPAEARRLMTLHAAVFVAGFAVVFSVIGASAGFAGTLVQDQIETLTRIGGVVLVVLGLHLSGLIHIPYLDRTYQLPAPRR